MQFAYFPNRTPRVIKPKSRVPTLCLLSESGPPGNQTQKRQERRTFQIPESELKKFGRPLSLTYYRPSPPRAAVRQLGRGGL